MKRILFILLSILPLTARPSEPTNTPPDIIHTTWFSHYEQTERHVDIYVPEGNQPLPVLYLLHGINGYEGDWQKKGGAVDTLIQMMKDGRCQPMILVMPDCNKWIVKKRPLTHGNRWKCIIRYLELSNEHKLEYAISDLMSMIDTTYATTDQCAIAGLSDGARMAANVANIRPDRIRFVGLFSPVLYKEQLPKDPSQTYLIYVGKNDIFKANGKRFHKRLTKADYPHQFIEIQGSHDWPVWRKCLSDFLEKISCTLVYVRFFLYFCSRNRYI